jgi:hypothetical protein
LTQPPDPAWLVGRARLALHYLERLSADSAWAHRASGLRGSLWRALAVPPERRDDGYYARLAPLVETAFWMLEQAAREIPDPRPEKTA